MSLGTRTVIRWKAPRREEGKEGGGGVVVVGCRRSQGGKPGRRRTCSDPQRDGIGDSPCWKILEARRPASAVGGLSDSR
jgi:hypothetical protein